MTEPTLALEDGQLDLLIQPTRSGEQTDGFHMEELWDERLVGVARRGHPLTRGRVTLERFASASHALVSPRGQPGGIVDDVLKQHGIPRRIAFTTPSFLVAPQVVAMTDLVMMLPARIAAALEAQLRLATSSHRLRSPASAWRCSGTTGTTRIQRTHSFDARSRRSPPRFRRRRVSRVAGREGGAWMRRDPDNVLVDESPKCG